MINKRLFNLSTIYSNSSTFSLNNLQNYLPRLDSNSKSKSSKKSQIEKSNVLKSTTTTVEDVLSTPSAPTTKSKIKTSKKNLKQSTKSLYKRSTHPTSVPLSKIFNNNFPLSISESIEHYKLRNNPLYFQNELLSTLPFFPNIDKLGRTSKILKIPIDNNGNYINEFVIYPPGKSEIDSPNLKHLLMIHGYGAGLGFFLKNFNKLSTRNDWCIHAIDLFGYGSSSRPHFYPTTLGEVEDWFFNSYDSWFKQRNIPKSNLLIMAHSMGAYLMALYGIKRDPFFCNKILMVSPGAILKHRKQIPIPGYFKKLWERNISPFSLVRKSGILGSKLVSGWSFRRFAKLSDLEKNLLHKYSYGIFSSNGSGEYMLNFLLAPGANARYPLIESGVHKLNCKISWWYGDGDWMDKKGGELCSNIINNLGKVKKSDVKIIKNSGHHIYLDNINEFNKEVLKEMDNFKIE
ncbi:uncharacterized protein KGF55_002731 [Candida pseudojiufengensis]|uniref:uncharacterized protein n=1 Tax=Candida pseudojiufengensis TaxID=497109 RepID=UPI0022245103|nr:uncharacterized protein KGF55_002731 [Candida pseudojiufengensis]KAI5962939.1 hypothetical protein KGF55_002731 [Candida pseudojiufengensis]